MGMNRRIERKGAMAQRRKEEKPRQREFPLRPLHLCAFAFFFFFFLPPLCRSVRGIRDRINEMLYLVLRSLITLANGNGNKRKGAGNARAQRRKSKTRGIRGQEDRGDKLAHR